MGSEKCYLTKQGFEKLKEELKYLKTVVRKEVIEHIKEARAQGDLSENAEYDAAKEKQGRTEAQIALIETKLANSVIIDDQDFPKDEVCIGSTIVLKNLDDKSEIVYTLVDASEANFAQGKISIASPVAESLLGHKKGEEINVELPAKTLRYKIVEIK